MVGFTFQSTVCIAICEMFRLHASQSTELQRVAGGLCGVESFVEASSRVAVKDIRRLLRNLLNCSKELDSGSRTR